jgi:DNA topoisomerase I
MSHSLVIVESPTKSKTIGRYLEAWKKGRFTVTSSVGHIIDLPERELGVDIDNNFEPTYVPSPRKSKVINELKRLARASEEILIATDQDREGEAIAWHIATMLKKTLKRERPIHRIRFNEITKTAIIESIQSPTEIDQPLVDAQQARRMMDRLVGYQVSPVLWKVVNRGLSAGRVQSVAVRLVCEREEEINAFNPQEYWSMDALFGASSQEAFDAQLQRVYKDEDDRIKNYGKPRSGEKPEIANKGMADAIEKEIRGSKWTVGKVIEKQTKRNAPAPFITSSLQQDAARRLGFSPKKTMMLAQQLYEGVEIDGGELTGLITYMRTDSMRLADSALEEARAYIQTKHGKDLLPPKPNVFKSKGKSQDAHEAIRPSMIALPPDLLKSALARDQHRLYSLIWNRFIACQMVPALFQQKTIDVLGGRLVFRATGSVLSRAGWLEAYGDPSENKKKGKKKERPVPKEIKEGEVADLLELLPEQHFTKPPARFSQESLIKTLEDLGIGRPSTYASIVDMILKRDYVQLEEKRFHPTELGITVNQILVTHFADIFNVNFTAKMEAELDDVEGGRDWKSVMHDFYAPFSEALTKANENRKAMRDALVEELDEKCPDCDKGLISKWGRNGRFIACSAYPDCRYTRNPGESAVPEETGEICEKCGAPMVIKTSRYGRFLGCSKYPECKGTKSIDLGLDCPREGCEGRIGEKRTKRGKIFYGCTAYPKCDFATWNKPEKTACPSCNHAWLGKKTSRKDAGMLECPKCGSQVDPESMQMGEDSSDS